MYIHISRLQATATVCQAAFAAARSIAAAACMPPVTGAPPTATMRSDALTLRSPRD